MSMDVYDNIDDEQLEELQQPIPGLLGRLKGWVRLVFGRKQGSENDNLQSQRSFSALKGSYNDVNRAAVLCEDAVKMAGSRVELINQQAGLVAEQSGFTALNALPDEDFVEIDKIINKIEMISKEKTLIQNQLSGFDKALDFLGRYESEVPNDIIEIKEAEKWQRLVQRDIGYLNGEKAQLEYDKETLENGMSFLYKFSIFLVCAFGLAAFAMGVLVIVYNVEVFLGAAVGGLLAICIGTVIYILRRKMRFEVKRNILMQIRAVELLNKKKLMYVHYTNYLDYEYKKYHIHNSDELNTRWEEYGYYKNLSGKHIKVRNIMYELEKDLFDYLQQKKIVTNKTSTDRLFKSIKNRTHKKVLNEINNDLLKIEEKLQTFDDIQAKIWNELTLLKERDETEDKLIEQMVERYLEDLEKMQIS